MNYNPMEVAELHPDYLGFIFWKSSARAFTGNMADIPPGIKKVGVFVDAPLEEVIKTSRSFQLQAVQLHGGESASYCSELRDRFQKDVQYGSTPSGSDPAVRPPEIIKVFRVGENFDFGSLLPYDSVCDYYLFDSRGVLPGGNGYAFDWTLLNAYPSAKPFFLSGGIGPGDVVKIKSFFADTSSRYCLGIDLNSRFEIRPGHKDVRELRKFMAALEPGGSTQNQLK